MFLAMLASGAKALPRSGGWLSVVKAVLGIVVLGLAFKYLLQAGAAVPGLELGRGKPNFLLSWGVFYLAFAAYMTFIDKSGETKAISIIKAVTVLALWILGANALSERAAAVQAAKLELPIGTGAGLPNALPGPVAKQWVNYTDEVFEEAKKSGKPIFIDGTADWCTLCQEIKEQVLDTPKGKAVLANVATIKVDLSTGVDPAFEKHVREKFKIVGLPHLMFFKPGGEPVKTVSKLESVEELKKLLEQSGAKL
jgi:thiol:disulfide interchange protein DsbD